MEQRLTEIVRPATYALVEQYRRLGLRERVLTLPVMVCLLLTLIWREVPSVSTVVQVLSRESLLWTPPLTVSQQAVSERLRTVPPRLLRALVQQILPTLIERAAARSRPHPPVIARTLTHFPHVWALDATTLEALFRRVGLLRDIPQTVLAGKLAGLLDVASQLPVALWWDDDATVNERSFLDRVKAVLPAGTLILLDKGFFGFPLFDWFTDHGCFFLTPDRQTTVYEVVQTLEKRPGLTDQIVRLGLFRSSKCQHLVRRIVVQVGGKQRAYLTNVLDPTLLPALDVVTLYGLRWRIEDAFALVKRLLGLSYVWTGAANGIQLQIWSTWLLYAVLVDLSDAVAEILDVPLEQISLEMVFRGLYHFSMAFQRGEASDPVAYLAAQHDLGIVKRRRKYRERERLAQRAVLLNL
jgi:hypothetical protein